MKQLRYMQSAAIDAILAYWQENDGNPLVDMATGTGKAITLCSLCKRLIEDYSDMRVLVCTHVVELVQQNVEEMIGLWPSAPVGIYASSLSRRDRRSQILFAQLQTVWNKVAEIGAFDLMIIDEVHLVPSDGNTMYRKLIDALLEMNPDMKICGFTATPYRLDSGRLDEGDDKLFDRVVYEYGIAQGIADGYLTRLTSKPTNTEYDMTGVHRLGGDFKRSELAAAVDKEDLTASAVAEIVAAAEADNRQCILAFCTSVEHAHHVRDEIRKYGKTCETITGNTPKDERRRIIEGFKRGDIWAVTNDSVMTTGTNVPRVDLIADMAPTESTSRYVQKAGRGTRPIYALGCDMSTAEGRIAAIAAGPKPNCLYMNFAGNVERHGPVDCVVPKKPGKGQGEAPVKICPPEDGGCREIVHASVRVCPCCGFQFPIDDSPKITAQASHTPILSDAEPEWYPVSGQTFNFHEKVGGLPSVRIEYRVGMKVHKTWVCPQHSGFAKSKADRWWAQHDGKRPFPASVDEFLDRADELLETAEVKLKFGGKYAEIVDFKPAERVEGANDNAPVVRRSAPRLALMDSEVPF